METPSKLLVVWTSGDREVALKMVFMYTFNAKKRGWWEEIRFLIWGPSSKLLSEDKELQQEIKKMKEAGVELVACKACADLYGVSDKLESLGIEVKYMGIPLTEMLKSDWTTITF
ncbi:MAG: DsrE family protein [Candidatus Aminicenantes bacterium]|nr:DsrE family protein [Candidatus Aminicenantes bacterium]